MFARVLWISASLSVRLGIEMETIKLLRDYFPTAVYTGKCLVFISEDWRVELTEHRDTDFSSNEIDVVVIRVRIFKKAINGKLIASYHED